MTVIDVHAHFVPPDVLETLNDRGRDFGIDLVETQPGCHCCRFESGMQIRPFFDTLMNTGHRLGQMDEQGVDREVLSIWTDIFGYDLPAAKGALWHTALNDSLTRRAMHMRNGFPGLHPAHFRTRHWPRVNLNAV